jgi:plasmid stability protein
MLVIAIAAVVTLGVRADTVPPLAFELLLILIGAGFGPVPSLTAVALQNLVARHQLGIAIGTMNFSRNLYATMLIAVFGAIVLATAPAEEPLRGALATGAGHAALGFGRVFFAAAASFSVALIAIMLMEERPLRTDAEADAKSLLLQAFLILDRPENANDAGSALVHFIQGESLRSLRNYKDAVKSHRRVVEIARHHLGSEHPMFAILLANLAGTERQAGDMAAAEKDIRQVLAIARNSTLRSHPGMLDMFIQVADGLRGRGDLAQSCEGALDTAHFSFLHTPLVLPDVPASPALFGVVVVEPGLAGARVEEPELASSCAFERFCFFRSRFAGLSLSLLAPALALSCTVESGSGPAPALALPSTRF